MKNLPIIVFALILGIYSSAIANNYGVIRTEDPERQNMDKWQEDAGVFEMTEKSEGSIIFNGATVNLIRNVQTEKLVGKDMYGNIYGTVGNTIDCGRIIDSSKEIGKNLQLTNKFEGSKIIDGLTVKLMRNVQSGKLEGEDMYGNIYSVIGNTDPNRKVIDPSRETIENIEMISEAIGSITRGGKEVILTRNKKIGKINGKDGWGYCYGVANNTNSNGKILDINKEIIANVSILK